MDNLKLMMISVVVLHHSMLSHIPGVGAWWVGQELRVSPLQINIISITDLFIMPVFFFVSGYFAPQSVGTSKFLGYVGKKAKRLLIPWITGLLILSPLYMALYFLNRVASLDDQILKAIYSIDSYIYFKNGISMSHLWFLPVLFVFSILCFPLQKAHVLRRLGGSVGGCALITILLSAAFMFGVSALGGFSCWVKTPLIEFQLHRILPYFLFFLLGAIMGTNGERRVWKAAVALSPLTVLVGAAARIYMNYHPCDQTQSLVIYCCSFIAVSMGMTFILFSFFGRFCNKSTPLLERLCSNSFGVYFVHICVIGLVQLVISRFNLGSDIHTAVVFVVSFALSNLLVSTIKRYL
jgi:fucose 4-O-acetylase-like acetyltransferase